MTIYDQYSASLLPHGFRVKLNRHAQAMQRADDFVVAIQMTEIYQLVKFML